MRRIKLAILSYATENRQWLYDITNALKRAYCEKHNIEFIFSTVNKTPERHPSWGKIPFILENIKQYDWVLWIDDDAAICNHSISLMEFIRKHTAEHEGCDIVMAHDSCALNCGVMLIRNSEYITTEFLPRWMSSDTYAKYSKHNNWEQGAFNDFYRMDEQLASRVAVAQMSEMNSFLPDIRHDKNPDNFHWYEDGDFILHTSGMWGSQFDEFETRNIIISKFSGICKQLNIHPTSTTEAVSVVTPRKKTKKQGFHNGHELITNMTTYPGRIELALEAYSDCITKQTMVSNKHLLWLGEDRFPGRILPDGLYDKFTDIGVEIKWVPADKCVHNRFEGCREYPDAYNFNIDDDIIYPDTRAEELMKNADAYPEAFINWSEGRYVWKGLKKVDTIIPPDATPQYCMRVWAGTSLFPPNTFPAKSFNYELERDIICPKYDEIWLEFWLLYCGTKTSVVCNGSYTPQNSALLHRPGTETVCLRKEYSTKILDTQINRVLFEYGAYCRYMPWLAEPWKALNPEFAGNDPAMIKAVDSIIDGRMYLPKQKPISKPNVVVPPRSIVVPVQASDKSTQTPGVQVVIRPDATSVTFPSKQYAKILKEWNPGTI